jgi:amphi-Trp domain-containing protein
LEETPGNPSPNGQLAGDAPARTDLPATGFTYVGLCDTAAVPPYLEALAESMRERNIVLVSGGETFTATPGELVKVRLEAGRSEEIVHVTIRLSWSEDALAHGQAPTLVVGSTKP